MTGVSLYSRILLHNLCFKDEVLHSITWKMQLRNTMLDEGEVRRSRCQGGGADSGRKGVRGDFGVVGDVATFYLPIKDLGYEFASLNWDT